MATFNHDIRDVKKFIFDYKQLSDLHKKQHIVQSHDDILECLAHFRQNFNSNESFFVACLTMFERPIYKLILQIESDESIKPIVKLNMSHKWFDDIQTHVKYTVGDTQYIIIGEKYERSRDLIDEMIILCFLLDIETPCEQVMWRSIVYDKYVGDVEMATKLYNLSIEQHEHILANESNHNSERYKIHFENLQEIKMLLKNLEMRGGVSHTQCFKFIKIDGDDNEQFDLKRM